MASSGYTAPAVLRAIAILEFVAGEATPPTLMKVSRGLGVSKSTLHGLLNALESVGWLRRCAEGGGYALGAGALALGRGRPHAGDIREAAEATMGGLAEKVGLTVFLGTPDGDEVVVQQVVESDRGMGISSRPGTRLPLLAPAFGRVVLAAMDPAVARRYLETHEITRFSERSPADADSYMTGVVLARTSGFAHDDEEFIPGARAIAVPIMWGPRVVAVLWVAAFASSLPETAAESIARRLSEAARTITSLLEARVDPRPGAVARRSR